MIGAVLGVYRGPDRERAVEPRARVEDQGQDRILDRRGGDSGADGLAEGDGGFGILGGGEGGHLLGQSAVGGESLEDIGAERDPFRDTEPAVAHTVQPAGLTARERVDQRRFGPWTEYLHGVAPIIPDHGPDTASWPVPVRTGTGGRWIYPIFDRGVSLDPHSAFTTFTERPPRPDMLVPSRWAR